MQRSVLGPEHPSTKPWPSFTRLDLAIAKAYNEEIFTDEINS